jgi:hypothetical protein
VYTPAAWRVRLHGKKTQISKKEEKTLDRASKARSKED